jgi:hypothetical protein
VSFFACGALALHFACLLWLHSCHVRALSIWLQVCTAGETPSFHAQEHDNCELRVGCFPLVSDLIISVLLCVCCRCHCIYPLSISFAQLYKYIDVKQRLKSEFPMPNASLNAHASKFATLSAQHGPTVSFFAQSESFARARSELCNLHCRPPLSRRKLHQKYKRNNDDEFICAQQCGGEDHAAATHTAVTCDRSC